MNNKKNNKGFSLVELIVVIAVMAVLVGVLAPAYLRYVDKAKLQKDVSAVGEVVEAIKIAAAEEAVYNEIYSATSGLDVTITDGSPIAGGTKLATELNAVVGTIDFTSTAMNEKTVKIKVEKETNTYAVKITVGGEGTTVTDPTAKENLGKLSE